MQIIIDEKEKLIYENCNIMLANLQYKSISINKEVLPLGDIILKTDDNETIAVIERKTLPDLLASIKDGRYEEQSYRLMNTPELQNVHIFYLIEGPLSTLRTEQERKLIFSVITSLHFFKDMKTLRSSSPNETSEMILCIANKIQKNIEKGIPLKKSNNTIINDIPYSSVVKKVKKDNITPENIGEIILSQIPGISSVTAIAIMKQYRTISLLIDELRNNQQCLDNIQYETNGKLRKINKSCISNIISYLL